MKRLVILLATLSVALFAVLAILSKGWLEPDGVLIFDSRVMGYDLAAAEAYLSALSPDARALYLGPFRQLDTVFPIVLGLTLVGALWLSSMDLSLLARIAILAVPVLYVWADLQENARVAGILSGGGGDAALVAAASRLTQLKWLTLGFGMLLLAGCAIAARRARKGQG